MKNFLFLAVGFVVGAVVYHLLSHEEDVTLKSTKQPEERDQIGFVRGSRRMGAMARYRSI